MGILLLLPLKVGKFLVKQALELNWEKAFSFSSYFLENSDEGLTKLLIFFEDVFEVGNIKKSLEDCVHVTSIS